MTNQMTLNIKYFAMLREQRGLGAETVSGSWSSLREVYAELRARHGFSLGDEVVRPAVGTEYVDWDTKPISGQTLVFIPPVSGG